MKRNYFLLVLLSTLSVCLQAHDYQTVYSHRTALFADAGGTIRGMRIDSVSSSSDSVLYPFKNIQKIPSGCYTPYGASWLGNKILVKKGWNYFFNEHNDSIRIKTDAKVGEQWTVYNVTDTYVVATVQKNELLSFMGLTDSVKTIVFYACVTTGTGSPQLNINKQFLSSPGTTILLSKHYGLIDTFNFLIFPNQGDDKPYVNFMWNKYDLVGLTHPNVGVQNLKWFDVYDFQVGDELHTLYAYSPCLGGSAPLFFNQQIKTVSVVLERHNYTDSIVYKLDNKVERINFETNKFVSVFSRDTIRSVIGKNVGFDKLPIEPVVSNTMAFSHKMKIDSIEKKIYPSDYEVLAKSSDSCWTVLMADGCFPDYVYYKGLGGPYFECWGFCGDYQKTALVYYKKGAATWGTPLVISGIHQPEMSSGISIYPNPTKDNISISTETQTFPCTFELFDISGSLLLRTEMNANQASVGLSRFSNGLYMYRLTNNGRLLKTGKVVKM
jgi:hypothetical protein